MKKIIVLITCILFITGCNNSRKLTSDSVLKKYLNKMYPGERFEILSKEKINMSGDVGGCGNPGEGSLYKIKSLNSEIEFSVYDSYHFNSFYCEYEIADNYLKIANKKFIDENLQYKIEAYNKCFKCYGIKFQKERYISKEEMKNSLTIVVNKLKENYPFKHKNICRKNVILISSNTNNSYEGSIDKLNKKKIDILVEKLYN